MTKPTEGSNRNVTAGKWFSFVEFVDELAKRKLTYVGTIKKINAKYPANLNWKKNREPEPILYGFTNQTTLCSYMPKNNRVVLVSSMYHNNEGGEDSKKPEIILLYYNSTKGGIDEADKK